MDAALFQFNPGGNPILLDPVVKLRQIPATGSTYVASVYFIAQIPIHRDFNGNLEQQISYIIWMMKSFQLLGGAS